MAYTSNMDDLDIIPIDVKYPNFIIDEEKGIAILGERTYIFDHTGAVISVFNYNDNKGVDYTAGEQYKTEEFSFPTAQEVIDAIVSHLPSLGDIVDAILGPLESILMDMINGVKNFFREQLASILAKFNNIIEYIQQLKQKIQDSINNIINYITTLYINAKNKVISAYEFVVEGVKYILNALKTNIKWLWRYTIKKVNQGIESAKEYANKTMKYFNYALYGFIIFIIITVILVSIFRFAPIDLRVTLSDKK